MVMLAFRGWSAHPAKRNRIIASARHVRSGAHVGYHPCLWFDSDAEEAANF